MKCANAGWFGVALTLSGIFLAVSNSWAGTMTLPGTGFDATGNALVNSGVDGSWTVTDSPYGSAAYVVMPGDPDWCLPGSRWIANNASNGWSGSSWINTNSQYGGGGVVPYTYSMSFNLAGFELNNNLQISGLWGIDDIGTLSINGNTIEHGGFFGMDGNPFAPFSLSYADNPTWFNAGTNTIAITMTDSDNVWEGVRFEGVVTGNAVPEPSTFVLLGFGAITLAAYSWRRRRRA